MECIAQLFFQNAEAYPDKQAIWCDGQTVTYSEMASFVSKYANYLLAHNVSYGDIIGIPMNNSIESVVLMLAAACIGVGIAPLNPTIPLSAIQAAFQASNVRHIIARRTFFDHMRKAGEVFPSGCLLCLDGQVEGIDSFDAVWRSDNTRPDVSRITGRETFILTMTSGSTGQPKPIELTQENKLKRAFAHVNLYGITKADRILAATPLYHSLAERLVLLPLLIGATSVLLPRFTPNLWLKCVQDQEATFTIAVSAQLGQIAQLLSSPFAPETTSLRSVVSSSALLEPHVRTELIEKLQCDFHEMYGTSECSTVTSINFREAVNKQNSVGRAIPEADICIIREDESIADIGEIGEIACKTELLFNSYYGMTGKTKEAFTRDGHFKTGDLGRMDEEGYLYFAGRKKEIIITGGINVYPYDIEQSLMKLPGVLECAAFPYPDERLGEVVAVAVVPEEGASLTKRAVSVYCARNLADFQQPHYVFILKKLPKNAMGKLLKSKIVEAVRIQETKVGE